MTVSGADSAIPRALLLVGAAAVAYLCWLLRLELVVLFAAAVFGIALYSVARWIGRRTGLSHPPSVIIAYLAGVLLFAGFFWFANHRLSSEYGELGTRIPAALENLESRLQGYPVMGTVAKQIERFRSGVAEDGEQAAGETDEEQRESEQSQMQLVRVSLQMLSMFVVWSVLSLYAALDGRRYYRGVMLLVPERHQEAARDFALALYRTLPRWLVGRLASMFVVALLTAPGLLILDVPLAILLSLIAGLFSFVPFLGPIASVVPAALLALEAVPQNVVWVFALFAIVQFLESNVVTPRIQRHMAEMPAVILISAQVIMGVVVGLVGVMFSTPLALSIMLAVQILYVRHHLGRELPPD